MVIEQNNESPVYLSWRVVFVFVDSSLVLVSFSEDLFGGRGKNLFCLHEFRSEELKTPGFQCCLLPALNRLGKLCFFTDVRQPGINSCPPSKKMKR